MACLRFGTPLGPMWAVADTAGLAALHFDGDDAGLPFRREAREDEGHPVLRQTAEQVMAYFRGERRNFTVPLAPAGTPFQHRVWRQLGTLSFGATATYRDIAAAIGRPTAIRAAGAANGANPVSIIVPCHRVIGSDGALTGYGGGLPRKRALLDFEAGRPVLWRAAR